MELAPSGLVGEPIPAWWLRPCARCAHPVNPALSGECQHCNKSKRPCRYHSTLKVEGETYGENE